VRVGADGNDFIAYTNNVERMRITSNGNLGIGTTTPNSKLVIAEGIDALSMHAGIVNCLGFNRNALDGTIFNSAKSAWQFSARDDMFTLEGYNGPPNSLFTVLKNGNVGIGTTSPNYKLSIMGNSGVHIVSSFLGGVVSGSYKYTGLTFGDSVGAGYSSNIGYMTHQTDKSLSGLYLTNYGDNEISSSLFIKRGGNIGIGTTNPTSKLTVAGNISSREVKVTVDAGADFVFENDYNLPSLTSLDTYIKENKHLPEIASAKEMQENGINLSEMNIKLLQKIEELTLYTIAQEEKNNIQSQKIEALEKEKEALKSLSERLSKLENQSKQ
jgi:hypothetical protein